ncbi:hypothetical protein GQ55_1G355800 [Panicum hallii var. hallii]|uniref:Uncharacterized protein n=1 Tax=Panicum hallii var. hallii TaxID=1504633 RepID=A0A2T7FB01_9POAL|nr:hypothetical protein GQ55_1G355800 [Panicum hallii var. hallii]
MATATSPGAAVRSTRRLTAAPVVLRPASLRCALQRSCGSQLFATDITGAMFVWLCRVGSCFPDRRCMDHRILTDTGGVACTHPWSIGNDSYQQKSERTEADTADLPSRCF